MASGERRRRVLVICKGNICRSPVAALIIGAKSGGLLETRSAGTRDWHVGKAAHPLMIAAAAGLGYDLSEHRGALLTPELIEWADDLVAVDEETALVVQALAGVNRPVRLLAAGGITDPWGGAPEGFITAVEEIEKATELYTV